jgi:glyoxylase-like metal-dependent hydrolase (beta-lactamase superfamily II)
MSYTTELPAGLALIDDLHLGRPQVIGTYLLLGDEPALVDPGPASCLPAVEAGLAAHGLALGDLRALLLTHIHLDHAGASGVILARNPRVRVYVHERGAPHLLDPSRLVSSAARLYGDMMNTLWGEYRPLPAEAITTLTGGETLRVGAHRLGVYDAPGHAKHHVIYYEETSGAAFVGDNAGVRLPALPFARPATPPPDVDLEAWGRTLDLLESLGPRYLCLTHFGAYPDAATHLRDYRERLAAWAELVRAGLASGASEAEQAAALEAFAAGETAGLGAEERAALRQQTGDLALSWRGLARYWKKREPAEEGGLGETWFPPRR